MSSFIGAGFKYILFGTVDDNGYFKGGTAIAPANGDADGSPAGILEGARSAPLTIPDDETVPVHASDGHLTNFDFEGDGTPSGTIETAVRNNVFEALVENTKVQTLGELEVSLGAPSGNGTKPSMCVILQRRAKKWDKANRGGRAWEIKIVPLCKIKPSGSDYQMKEFNPYGYNIISSKASRMPWGSLMTENDNGGDSSGIINVDADYPIFLHRFTGDGTDLTLNLDFTIISPTSVNVFVDGVLLVQGVDFSAVAGESTISFLAGQGPTDGAIIEVLQGVYDNEIDARS